MRADAFLAAAEALPLASLDEIAGGRGVVVVAPHPDDESLGCGGLIAQACAFGLPVRVVILSDGVGSHPNSMSHPPDRLRRLRERETLDAARALGLGTEHVSFLGLPDRFVPKCGTDAGTAADRIADAIGESGANTVLVTWVHDPHCDHKAAAAIVRLARERAPWVRLMECPVWGWSLPPYTEVGDSPLGVRLDVSHHLDAKRAAVASHRSQITDLIDDDPSGFRLDPAMLQRFMRTFEIYLDVSR